MTSFKYLGQRKYMENTEIGINNNVGKYYFILMMSCIITI